MISTIFGIVLCAALFVVFVLFVHPKGEGEGGCGHNCATCHIEGNCSIAETDHEH